MAPTKVEVPPITPVTSGDNPLFDQTEPNHSASTEGPSSKLKDRVGKLGQNRASRSAVRALTNSDRDALIQFYVGVGMTAKMFNSRAADAIVEQAESCANAWMELAKKNDAVRKALLAMMEGGAWGGVIFAHLPIVMAFLPEGAMARILPFPTVSENGDGEARE